MNPCAKSADFHLAFIGVGPMKTASSWLDAVLRQHPETYLPKGVKETFFLTKRFDRGWAWYEHYFADRQPKQQCGEIAPTLFRDPKARRRLLKTFPEARIIISLRDPVERTYSHFLHSRAKGRVPDNFFKALKIQPSILDAGRYHLYAPNWERDFSPEKIYYLFSEDVAKEPVTTAQQIFRFLELDQITISTVTKQVGAGMDARSTYVSRYSRKVSRSLRSMHLDGLVNILKQFGGHKLLYKKRVEAPMPKQIRQFLEKEHERDCLFYNQRYTAQKSVD